MFVPFAYPIKPEAISYPYKVAVVLFPVLVKGELTGG